MTMILTIHDRLRNSTHDINQFTWQSESENAQPSQFMRCLHLTECCGPRQILTNSQPTNQYNEQEAGWENKRETRELLQFWIHWKQLWHWYWNIAGINTIYLSIFTLIYSPSIQYNEIIEGLSLGRNIRFNPRLLMVSKRGGEGKDKNDQKDYLETHLKRKIAKCWWGVWHFNSFHIHLFLPTLYLAVGQWKSLDKRTSLTNCPSQWPVRHHYPPRINSLYKPFAYSPVRETAACFGGQSNLNTQLTVIGIKLRCRD